MVAKYQVRLLNPAEAEEWDRLVTDSPQGSIFSKFCWFTTVSRVYGIDYRLYGCFQGKELVGGAGVFVTRRWGKRWATRPLLTPYQGILIRRSHAQPRKARKGAQAITEALITTLEKDFHFLKLDHYWTLEDVLPFTWAGWQSEVLYTVLIPLEDPDGLFASLDRKDRAPVRIAQKEGFSCQVDHDYEEFYRLFAATFAKQNLTSALSRNHFIQMAEDLTALGLCRVYLLKTRENRNIAGMVVLLDDQHPYAWVGGTDPAYLDRGAAPFLMWEIIRDLAGKYAYLDLGSAGIKSITRFKKNMGGILRPYYATTKFNSPFLKALRIAREILHLCH